MFRIPDVGILYAVGDKLFIDSTPLSQAGHYGDHLIRERGHDEYWGQLIQMGAVRDAEYEEYPRGRVAYDTKSGQFRLLADKCILSRKGVVRKILSRLHVSPKDTETGADPH